MLEVVLFVFSFAGLSMVAIQGKAQVIMIALLCPKEVGSHLMSGNLYGIGLYISEQISYLWVHCLSPNPLLFPWWPGSLEEDF